MPASVYAESVGHPVANVRLIGERTMVGGAYQVGISVEMASGSHTYWKEPGDAGVPPVFAFDGSANVGKAEVRYPAPTRITEDGLAAIGYADRVVFPVVVTPDDAKKPSTLHLEMTYAVCNKICMPGHATADIGLPVVAPQDHETELVAAFAGVPRQLPPARQSQLTVAPVPDAAKPTWTLRWSGEMPVRDMFVEAQDGYTFETKVVAPQTWSLTASQAVSAPGIKSVAVTVTVTGPEQSFTTIRMLDFSNATL